MSLSQHLERSAATAGFRAAVRDFLSSGRPNDRVRFSAQSPPVKVERALTKALQAHPELPVESVEIEARSGCEYYRGTIALRTADDELRVRFDWDCKWKAQQQGWTDAFGLPDQIRAARTFGYDCFRVWETMVAPLPVVKCE